MCNYRDESDDSSAMDSGWEVSEADDNIVKWVQIMKTVDLPLQCNICSTRRHIYI